MIFQNTFQTRNPAHGRVWIFETLPLFAVIISLWLKMVYFSISLRVLWALPEESIGNWLRTYPQIFTSVLASLLLLFALLPLVRRARRFLILLLLDLLLTTLIVCDLIYAHYYSDVPSMQRFADLKMLPLVSSSIFSQLNLRHAFFYIDIIIGVLALPLYLRLSPKVETIDSKAKRRLSFAMLIGGLVFALPTAVVVFRDTNGLFAYRTLKRDVCAVMGPLPYHLTDAALRVFSAKTEGRADFQRAENFLIAERKQESPSPMFGIARGKNLIVIMAESLQAFPIGLKIDGQAVAPRLTEFARESLYFPNFYDQTYLGTTADGEFTSFQSLHPLPAGVVAIQYHDNHYNGLPALLAKHGYATLSAAAEDQWFWYMNVMHPKLGFQHSFFEKSYAINERIGEWLPDKEFFLQTIPILEKETEPFMAYLLTSSNHDPWDLPQKYRTLKLGSMEGTMLGNYLQSVHYFDEAFGALIDGLRSAELLEKSVVVIYGDHQACLEKSTDFNNIMAFPENSEYQNLIVRKKIPLIIRLPNKQSAGIRETTGGHLDISPTLLALMGISEQNKVMFGNDLTRGKDSFVVFRDGSFVDGKHLLLNRFGSISNSTCYEVRSGRAIDCKALEADRRRAREELEVSDDIIRGDLIPELLSTNNVAERQ